MNLNSTDKEIFEIIKDETKRQQSVLRLIPSENYVSEAVLEAVGSPVMNKYSEGQAKKRYYQGNENIDKIELLAKKRALEAFNLDENVWSVNVQAANGSTANMAVYNALLNPNDKILGMYLYDGGHLSHGWKLPDGKEVSATSRNYKSAHYHVDPKTQVFDYDKILKIAKKEKPQILVSGGTAYPRQIDHEKMGDIARNVGAYYLADIAHEAGLISAGVNNSPFEYADVTTLTTRKTLRGPIGALIFAKKDLISKINKAVFPGLQGGPLNHNIAGIAVALHEALQPEFKTYAKQILKNAKVLETQLKEHKINLVSGGTDKHLLLLDLQGTGVDGWTLSIALEQAGIITNRNTIPNDPASPFYPSGLRIGTPAVTTRGMREDEMIFIASKINDAIKITKNLLPKDMFSDDVSLRKQARANFKSSVAQNESLQSIKKEVENLCKRFPIYENL